MTADLRLDLLKHWLASALPSAYAKLGWGAAPPSLKLTSASSDASFRRYFRLEGPHGSLIVMDAPPPQENCEPFVRIATLLKEAGLWVPQILAQDLEHGFLLLSDLGRRTWLELLCPENADELFAKARASLIQMQKLPHPDGLPEYDQAIFARELALFPDWYLAREVNLKLSPSQQQLWDKTCALLIDNAVNQTQVFVHRDFMPRNLMDSQPNPGILDFQDALWGPISYDITCLFKDAFLSWPLEQVDRWLEAYWNEARAAELKVPEHFDDFLRHCDLMGAQRHLKVIGIFARIKHRDGKPKYLSDAPRFFAYLDQVIARRPQLAELGELLASIR